MYLSSCSDLISASLWGWNSLRLAGGRHTKHMVRTAASLAPAVEGASSSDLGANGAKCHPRAGLHRMVFKLRALCGCPAALSDTAFSRMKRSSVFACRVGCCRKSCNSITWAVCARLLTRTLHRYKWNLLAEICRVNLNTLAHWLVIEEIHLGEQCCWQVHRFF